jgi:hypothetical protein
MLRNWLRDSQEGYQSKLLAERHTQHTHNKPENMHHDSAICFSIQKTAIHLGVLNASRGHEVHLFARAGSSGQDYEIIDGVHVHRVHRPHPTSPAYPHRTLSSRPRTLLALSSPRKPRADKIQINRSPPRRGKRSGAEGGAARRMRLASYGAARMGAGDDRGASARAARARGASAPHGRAQVPIELDQDFVRVHIYMYFIYIIYNLIYILYI